MENAQWIGVVWWDGETIVNEQTEWSDIPARVISTLSAQAAYTPKLAGGGTQSYSMSKLPPEYQNFAEVFGQEAQSALPEHGDHDMRIELEPGKILPSGRLYPLSRDELELLKEYLEEMVRNGKIRPRKGRAGAPIFFAKQPNGKLRIVVDYWGLNAITIKDKYPVPLMTTLVEQVASAKIFTKLDLKSGFNLIRIAEGDEWKTAFTCRYRLFEYMVMPFGLSNAPATFQRYINNVLQEYIDRGIVVYIDDIIIYTETLEEHIKLVRWVLERLAEKHLCVNLEKSEFHIPEVMFCGYVVGQTEVKMAENKVKEILEWSTPRNKKEVQSFLGFTNFY